MGSYRDHYHSQSQEKNLSLETFHYCSFSILFIYSISSYILKYCLRINNFNGVFEIMAGLNMGAVRRLAQTWNVRSIKMICLIDDKGYSY